MASSVSRSSGSGFQTRSLASGFWASLLDKPICWSCTDTSSGETAPACRPGGGASRGGSAMFYQIRPIATTTPSPRRRKITNAERILLVWRKLQSHREATSKCRLVHVRDLYHTIVIVRVHVCRMCATGYKWRWLCLRLRGGRIRYTTGSDGTERHYREKNFSLLVVSCLYINLSKLVFGTRDSLSFCRQLNRFTENCEEWLLASRICWTQCNNM